MGPSRITIHIAKELSVWMLIGLAGSVFIFVSTQMVRLAPLFVGAGGKLPKLVEMLALLAVPVCGWSLTPAFAVAVFATFARMSRDGETVALDAAGISRKRIAEGRRHAEGQRGKADSSGPVCAPRPGNHLFCRRQSGRPNLSRRVLRKPFRERPNR
jgi:hypothetical protein